MDSLPLETLQRIFELACSDGGLTGNSLSLTSKGVRSASRTARFRSIILIANARCLRSFMALYERECDPAFGDRPHIQHLFLMFPSIGGTGNRPGASSAEDIALPSDFDDLETEDVDIYIWPSCGRQRTPDPTASPGYLAAARTLFHLITPDLQTLTIKSSITFGGQLELACIEQPLPHLRELALVDVREPRALFAEGGSGPPLFPRLTHLHIVSDFTVSDLAFPMWAEHAPRLTHLRVTGVTDVHVSQLARVVGVKVERYPAVVVHIPGSFSPPSPPPPPPPRTKPSVRVLVMQPCPPPRGGFCGNPMIEHGEMVDDLHEIERQCQGSGVRVTVLLPTDGADGAGDANARAPQEDWIGRIHCHLGDAIGCWPGSLYVNSEVMNSSDEADLQLSL